MEGRDVIFKCLFQETPDKSTEARGLMSVDWKDFCVWEEESLMNGVRAVKVTLTERQEVKLSSGEKEVY